MKRINNFFIAIMLVVISAVLFKAYATVDTFALANRTLWYDNTVSKGLADGKVGMYKRDAGDYYVYETLMYADLSSISGATIDSVKFQFQLGTANATTISFTGELYEQNLGAYNASAIFDTYSTTTAWSNLLGSVSLPYNDTVGTWYQISTAALATKVGEWVSGTTTNNGLILSGDPRSTAVWIGFTVSRLIIYYTLNSPPTDISLSPATIAENQSSGTYIGKFTTTDPDAGDSHTYTFDGGTDDASFSISNDSLFSAASFDYEIKSSYSVTVKTTDQGGLSYSKTLTVSVTNVNEAPTNLTISNNVIAENQSSGTYIGKFTTTDPDAGDSHTYTFDGGTDDASFSISNDSLFSATSFDYETKSSYSITVKTTDFGGLSLSKALTITITDLNDVPTDISLSSTNVNENQPSGTYIGKFTTTDQDASDTHTYTFVAGTGDTDNGSFTISNDSLFTGAKFFYEDKTSYSIRVQTDDGSGGTFSKAFTISINNILTGNGTANDASFFSGWKIGGGVTDTRQLSSAKYFNGNLDEIRIESGARNSDWIKLCYETQKPSQICVTFSSDDSLSLLPLTEVDNLGTGSSDTILIYTDNWSIIFDEDIGGGIKFLSNATAGGGVNQISTTNDIGLFDLKYYIASSSTSGVLSLVESNSLFVKVKQEVMLSDVSFTVIYTIFGDGRVFANVKAFNNSGSSQSNNLYFRVYRNIVGTAKQITSSATASTAKFVLNADDGAGQFDIMLSPFGLWNDASGFDNGAATVAWIGYRDLSRTLPSGYTENWDFMIDFGHSTWNDTTDEVKYFADVYQSPDSLTMNRGTYRMERAWEENMMLHLAFDENNSGSADTDTSKDLSGGTTLHSSKIKGGTWSIGKIGPGALTLGGTDSIEILNSSDFLNTSVFTITAWIKKSTTTESNALIFGDASATTTGYKFISDADKLNLVYSGTTLPSTTALGTTWHFVVATADVHKGWLKLFIDGKIDTTYNNISLPFTAGSGPISIGNNFTGTIDDIRFFAKEFSEETIYAMYNNSYRSGQGMYSVRCDNNSSVDLNIAGSSVLPRYNPVFEITNYWASTKPRAVYYNNHWQSENTNYICILDDVANKLYLGFKKAVRSDVRIYLDDFDSTGAYMTGPTKKMFWGVSGSDFYVQNFTGSTFGIESDNQFYLYYKMPTATNLSGGEPTQFKSSVISPLTTVATASNTIGETSQAQGSMGSFDNLLSASYVKSVKVSAQPTYTVLESSNTRIRLRINTRTASNTETYDIMTEWTIYPTGQIFRFDSTAAYSQDISSFKQNFFQIYDASVSSKLDDINIRAVAYGGSSVHDISVAKLYTTDKNGVATIFGGTATDTAGFESSSGSNYSGPFFRGDNTILSINAPFKFYNYIDISKNNMDSLYMDSVTNSVSSINFTDADMKIGTRVTTSTGDVNGDGFNEREGCYVVSASNNTVDFTIQADGATDGSRFYPAIKVINYFANYKPRFVHLYTATDTATLIEGYQYNIYQDKTSHYLVIQLDTVLTSDVNMYISDDADLAVTISKFKAFAGNRVDTIAWTTESEHENLGFYIYRRISPNYLDSIDNLDVPDSLQTIGMKLFTKGKISYKDTVWKKINKDIIPGVPGGTSYGTRNYCYVDKNVTNSIKYEYRLQSISFKREEEFFGPISVVPNFQPPKIFTLYGNFPNPVRRYTYIRFDLPTGNNIILYIYNMQGRVVKKLIDGDFYKAGFHKVVWDVRDANEHIASGAYIYRMKAGHYVKARSMFIIK